MRILLYVCVLMLIGCQGHELPNHLRADTPYDLLTDTEGERFYFNEYSGFVVGSGFDFSGEDLENLAIASIDLTAIRVSVALENFESPRVAEALVRAADRGVDVRVVTDEDRLAQSGFGVLQDADIHIEAGDGEILWQAEFGKDPVIRAGEDNQMVHNFFVFDHLRVLTMTNGFEGANQSAIQFGFAMNSEDLAKDFEDSFDQLYGGVFSTEMTFFQDGLSSDSNRRSHYPTPDGTLELYFGPQEPVVKEVIDSVYSARSTVWVASPILRNTDLLSALRYKHEAGFDVRILTAEALGRDWSGVFNAKTSDAVTQTLVIIDGGSAIKLPGYARGKAFVSSIPLLQSVPFYRPNGDPNANPVAQASDHFIDGSLMGVHQVDPAMADHFLGLKQIFEGLYDAQ